jgi:hypothetical protein
MSPTIFNPKNISSVSQNVFVVFSGHNERAVITLCRFFSASNLSFAIVCADQSDLVLHSEWHNQVVLSRIDRALDASLFDIVFQAVREVHGASAHPIYCPTSEFMNYFILHERNALQQIGWKIILPTGDVYAELTSKSSSPKVVEKLIGLVAPPELSMNNLQAPCVLKPRINVDDGKVHYPILCATDEELEKVLEDCDSQRWFAQRWIDGQSYYLCAYITSSGRYAHFWQQNLLQQPGGKSIVLARTVPNPGLPTEPLFLGLIEKKYHGPFMMEVIQGKTGDFYYIEINPRFWGPLQLALDACPEILRLFAYDVGIELDILNFESSVDEHITHWYAWKQGAKLKECRRYPALAQIELTQSVENLLNSWDVYSGIGTPFE